MKIFIFLLLIAAFLQTSFLALNLCLILIIARSFMIDDKSNYYAAFFTGIILGVLANQNLGFWPLVLISVTKIIQLSKKLPVSSNALTVGVMSFLIVVATASLEKLFYSNQISVVKILLETSLVLPIFLMIKFWEDRFVVKHEIKLKIRS